MSQFELPENIKKLDYKNIKNNLFKYKYDSKKLKNYFENPTPELEHLYSSFKGEVYENILYEMLLDYAKDNQNIKQFVLKGPHQTRDRSKNKSGLLIDKSNQIVYKAAYKDISEFDAFFFTESELYFVEMSTSKKTASLNKRLFKKYALLKVLFPKYEIKALIILTNGSTGLKAFPSYCSIWITDELNDDNLLKELLDLENSNYELIEYQDSKFVECDVIEHSNFKYYQTLKWILFKSRENKRFSVDLNFFNSKNIDLYFDIYTKLYIGYLTFEDFKSLVPQFEKDVKDDKVIVTVEKLNQKSYGIVYYPKESTGQLKRVRVEDNCEETSIKNKESEGFTNAEVKFMLNVLSDKFKLTLDDINHINKNISIIKTKVTKK